MTTHTHTHKSKLHFTVGCHVYIEWVWQHFEVLSAVLLDSQVFWDVVTLQLMRGSWHFEGLLCLHLQVSNMDLSSTCKVSFFLDCLTLEDESDTILQNTRTTHPMTLMTRILSTRFVRMEICNTRLSNMNSARHWFSGMYNSRFFCLFSNNKINAA